MRWKKYAVLQKIRHQCRVFWPYWSSARTWEGFIHRIHAVRASYQENRQALITRLAEMRFRQKRRSVIAISHVYYMGDIVACEPIIRRVRAAHPDAFLVMCVQRFYAELVETHPEIDYVLPLECVFEWSYFAQSALFNQVVDLNMDHACELCGMEWVKPDGSHGVTGDNYYYFGSLLQAYARSVGLEPLEEGPRLYIPSSCAETIEALGLPAVFVALHAGSNDQKRQLCSQTWQHVVQHINDRWHMPVVEIGTEPLVIATNDSFNRTLCGQLSILQSAEVIRRSRLYLGSDSGPAHLANAVGTYGIIALGNYRHWRTYMPYSGGYANGVNCQLLHYDGPVAELPIEEILASVDRRLSEVAGSNKS